MSLGSRSFCSWAFRLSHRWWARYTLRWTEERVLVWYRSRKELTETLKVKHLPLLVGLHDVRSVDLPAVHLVGLVVAAVLQGLDVREQVTDVVLHLT